MGLKEDGKTVKLTSKTPQITWYHLLDKKRARVKEKAVISPCQILQSQLMKVHKCYLIKKEQPIHTYKKGSLNSLAVC